jgi:hypothetical protein
MDQKRKWRDPNLDMETITSEERRASLLGLLVTPISFFSRSPLQEEILRSSERGI